LSKEKSKTIVGSFFVRTWWSSLLRSFRYIFSLAPTFLHKKTRLLKFFWAFCRISTLFTSPTSFSSYNSLGLLESWMWRAQIICHVRNPLSCFSLFGLLYNTKTFKRFTQATYISRNWLRRCSFIRWTELKLKIIRIQIINLYIMY